MSRNARLTILTGLLLAAVVALVVPTRVLSGQLAGRGPKVFHTILRFDQNALTSGEILNQRVKSFGHSVFGGHASKTNDETALNQFLSTVRNQAIHENWRSLAIDVWVGGKDFPAGYFFCYEGVDSRGLPVEGGAFITADTAFVKANLREYQDLSRISFDQSK